jgi:(1->4)-alpha-D-glucan 1-alpha-D-glucosylmutase
MEKAAREAGESTQWSEPNTGYETALRDFITGIMADATFMKDAEKFVASISPAGFINSLSQTLLKLTAPGVPDIYQGCELWNFSLVDPDNRRPVNFEIRRQLLRQIKHLRGDDVLKLVEEPMAKLWLIWKILAFRAMRPEIFSQGGYAPLYATGGRRMHLVAFKRGDDVITAAPRLNQTLRDDWRDTTLHLPEGEWQNIFTEENFSGGEVLVKDLLRQFPMALLVRKGSEL